MIRTLNLTNLERSDIRYKKIPFPDGQQQVLINPKDLNGYFDTDGEGEYWKDVQITKVQIKARLNNFLDLELITCTVASLRELEVEEIHLYTPYIMGARSDRKFDPDKDGFIGNNYVKDVIAPAINALNFKSVTCIDPHSNILEACIKNFKKIDNQKLVDFCFSNLIVVNNTIKNPDQTFHDAFLENIILVSPDEGASKKIYKLAEQISYKGDIITCSKERDENGNLVKAVVPFKNLDFLNKDLIIVDDILDAGGTFINIAKKIKEDHHITFKGKIYLIITHGIFSKSFQELSKYFDGIYCTNSYADDEIIYQKARYSNCNKPNMRENFIKQLNVF